MSSPTTTSRFCSICAQEAGLSPAGHGGAAYETIIAVELPLPWPKGLFGDAARMPAEILALMKHIREAYQRDHTLRIRTLGIAPDKEYSAVGMRQVICWRRSAESIAQFERSEYLAPEEAFGPLVYALALQPEQLSTFATYRIEAGEVRDLLVCTHGSADAACSKFGYPTYDRLRKLAADSGGRLRAWRTTHFGGHVFAPTLLDMPHGSYWAYIEPGMAEWLVSRSDDIARLPQHYRGWAGLPAPFLQVLERELFVRHGWSWLAYAKSGRVLVQDETAQPNKYGNVEPAWAEVQIDYQAPDGAQSSAIARIERTTRINVIHTSGQAETYAHPQYAVAWLREERN